MEHEKVQINEKTAKMLEEMEKSLRNMEQSLGMDHPVIGKLLDSYAKLLRQNNIRHLDALNMEARAKAIRAKNNKEEAQKQSEGLAETKQEKHMSASQMRMISQGLAALLACGFLTGAYQMYNWFEAQKAKKPAKINLKGLQFVDTKRGLRLPRRPDDDNQSDLTSKATATDMNKTEQTQVQAENPTPPGTQTDPEESLTATTTTSKTTVMELANQMKAVKEFAKEKLAAGTDAEREKDFPKASALYFEAIQNAQSTLQAIGRPVFSEEIAKCYEGYGRMAELDAHPEIARQCEQTAAEVRSHIND